MPLTHIRSFRVRHHECDIYGRVHPAVYMRYAQEAAFDASAAAGYDLSRYEELDRLWLARETGIEYSLPLRYGDDVQVKTWVVDFRRVRSIRAYEFRHAASCDLVARAHTDWVHLELSTGLPIAVTPKMRAAFFPEGPPPPAPPRKRFPSAPVPPPGAFSQVRRVAWHDVDAARHVNNTVYLTYVEECALQSLASQGWTTRRLEGLGLTAAIKSHRIEYRQPALLDDEVELTTWVSDLQPETFVRHTTIARPADGATISRARTVHTWEDLETGGTRTMPDSLLTDIAPLVAR